MVERAFGLWKQRFRKFKAACEWFGDERDARYARSALASMAIHDICIDEKEPLPPHDDDDDDSKEVSPPTWTSAPSCFFVIPTPAVIENGLCFLCQDDRTTCTAGSTPGQMDPSQSSVTITNALALQLTENFELTGPNAWRRK